MDQFGYTLERSNSAPSMAVTIPPQSLPNAAAQPRIPPSSSLQSVALAAALPPQSSSMPPSGSAVAPSGAARHRPAPGPAHVSPRPDSFSGNINIPPASQGLTSSANIPPPEDSSHRRTVTHTISRAGGASPWAPSEGLSRLAESPMSPQAGAESRRDYGNTPVFSKYKPGDTVEVWSVTSSKWFTDGMVKEVAQDGAVLVSYAHRADKEAEKWIDYDQTSNLIRPTSMAEESGDPFAGPWRGGNAGEAEKENRFSQDASPIDVSDLEQKDQYSATEVVYSEWLPGQWSEAVVVSAIGGKHYRIEYKEHSITETVMCSRLRYRPGGAVEMNWS